MAELPVPAEIFFNDFSFSLENYDIKRAGSIIGTVQGLSNDDEDGPHIAFLFGANILAGDELINQHESITVKKVKIDTFHGKPELLKALY